MTDEKPVTATTEKVTVTTWRDTATLVTNVSIRVNGRFVGNLHMTDPELIAFSEAFGLADNGSYQEPTHND